MAPENYPQLDARSVAHTLGRRAWQIAALVLAAFVLVYAVSSLQQKVYSSSAEVSISGPASSLPGTKASTTKDATVFGNEIYLMKSAVVANAARAKIGDEVDKIQGVTVTRITDTDVLRVVIRSTSPDAAMDAANAYASAYTELRQAGAAGNLRDRAAAQTQLADAKAAQIADLTAQLKASPTGPDATVQKLQIDSLSKERAEAIQQSGDLEAQASDAASSVSVVKDAGRPRFPDSPTPLRDAGVAAAVALILGIGLALLFEQLDNRIKSSEQITRISGGLPVLGSIPVFSPHSQRLRRFHNAERTLVPPTSPSAEAYRTLATSLRFSNIGKEKRTILVTSSSGGEGKTTVTANLAAVLVESGLRVVVVSADLRRPMLGDLLGVAEVEKGLTSAMLGDDDLSSCFISVPLRGRSLFVMPAGPLPHEPAVLLGSDMFGTVLDKIKQAGADFILIDCAPVLPVSDPLAAARHVDGVILMTLAGKTRENELSETVDRLKGVDADIIGVVLNGVASKGSTQGYYGYRPIQRPDPPAGATPGPTTVRPLRDVLGHDEAGNGNGNGNGRGATRPAGDAETTSRDPDTSAT